jgi:energy-converting hydrogenase Eha subunit A
LDPARRATVARAAVNNLPHRTGLTSKNELAARVPDLAGVVGCKVGHYIEKLFNKPEVAHEGAQQRQTNL